MRFSGIPSKVASTSDDGRTLDVEDEEDEHSQEFFPKGSSEEPVGTGKFGSKLFSAVRGTAAFLVEGVPPVFASSGRAASVVSPSPSAFSQVRQVSGRAGSLGVEESSSSFRDCPITAEFHERRETRD